MHTMENGREIDKFYPLRMGPGSEVASACAPVVLPAASRGIVPPQARQGHVARRLEPESWVVGLRHWGGAWTLAGRVSLPSTGPLGKSALKNSEEQFVISPSNVQKHSFSWDLICWESVPCGGLRLSIRVCTPPTPSISSTAWSHQKAGAAPK